MLEFLLLTLLLASILSRGLMPFIQAIVIAVILYQTHTITLQQEQIDNLAFELMHIQEK